ncbi:Uncharacterized protein dnm_061780 [Desulfonema magnum]|uniref:Uncharacterized protein n=1 Tax=Desulfonema magnum TaxID=45655 RepID=A0A975GQQ6_9BACT|nr:Uncharacterized protein dnm_061780 [Desulfonema magnum]
MKKPCFSPLVIKIFSDKKHGVSKYIFTVNKKRFFKYISTIEV